MVVFNLMESRWREVTVRGCSQCCWRKCQYVTLRPRRYSCVFSLRTAIAQWCKSILATYNSHSWSVSRVSVMLQWQITKVTPKRPCKSALLCGHVICGVVCNLLQPRSVWPERTTYTMHFSCVDTGSFWLSTRASVGACGLCAWLASSHHSHTTFFTKKLEQSYFKVLQIQGLIECGGRFALISTEHSALLWLYSCMG